MFFFSVVYAITAISLNINTLRFLFFSLALLISIFSPFSSSFQSCFSFVFFSAYPLPLLLPPSYFHLSSSSFLFIIFFALLLFSSFQIFLPFLPLLSSFPPFAPLLFSFPLSPFPLLPLLPSLVVCLSPSPTSPFLFFPYLRTSYVIFLPLPPQFISISSPLLFLPSSSRVRL